MRSFFFLAAAIARSIATLRRLLNDDTHDPHSIATVLTVGYRSFAM
jgi:DNA-binding winged helix-turn-helix (wHTH) protein